MSQFAESVIPDETAQADLAGMTNGETDSRGGREFCEAKLNINIYYIYVIIIK